MVPKKDASSVEGVPKRPQTAPKFSKEPAPLEVFDGERAVFECHISGFPEPKLTWFVNDEEIRPSKDFKITFKDGVARLEIVEVFPDDGGMYSCKAVNDAGGATCTTKLTVSAKGVPGTGTGTAPKFVTLLEPRRVRDGEKATFLCVVRGNPPPQIRWFKDSQEVKSSRDFKCEYDIKKGKATLVISEVFPDDQGLYRCVAVNLFGKDETSAPLTVTGEPAPSVPKPVATVAPVFVTGLKDVSVLLGKRLEFCVQVKGTPAPEVRWFFEGKRMKPTKVFQMKNENNNWYLTITEVLKEDAGRYEACAVNSAGKAISKSNVTVTVPPKVKEVPPEKQIKAPSFLVPLEPQNVPSGVVVTLSVEVAAEPEANFRWYHDDKIVKKSRDFQIISEKNKSKLIIMEAFEEDAGEYCCKAENSVGSCVTKALLSVEPSLEEQVPPKFTFQLSPLTVMDGEEVRFTCDVEGRPMPKVTWYHNGLEIRQY